MSMCIKNLSVKKSNERRRGIVTRSLAAGVVAAALVMPAVLPGAEVAIRPATVAPAGPPMCCG